MNITKDFMSRADTIEAMTNIATRTESNYDEREWKQKVDKASLSTLRNEREHLGVLIINNSPDVEVIKDERDAYPTDTVWEPATDCYTIPNRSILFKSTINNEFVLAWEIRSMERFSTVERQSNYNTAKARLDIIEKRIAQMTDITSVL